MMKRKIFAMMVALLTGSLGITAVTTAQQASAAAFN
jgi:hypothetical protein